MANTHHKHVESALVTETATIQWKELQYFFASGKTIYVSDDLDLIDVARNLRDDNTVTVRNWMQQNKIMPVSNDQARQWYNQDSSVWAVVVKPWVLVQNVNTRHDG